MAVKAMMNRDFWLRSKSGHTIFFPKGVPVNIPALVAGELETHGAVVSGNEDKIAAQKAKDAKDADYEAKIAAEKAKAAAAERELALIKMKDAEAAELKRLKDAEEHKLKEEEKAKLKRAAASKKAAAELKKEQEGAG